MQIAGKHSVSMSLLIQLVTMIEETFEETFSLAGNCYTMANLFSANGKNLNVNQGLYLYTTILIVYAKNM